MYINACNLILKNSFVNILLYYFNAVGKLRVGVDVDNTGTMSLTMHLTQCQRTVVVGLCTVQ